MSHALTHNTTAASNVRGHGKKSKPTFHFLAGLASGVSSAVLLQPADLLKTRMQQARATSLLPVLRSILAGPHPITSLWRGTVPSALRTGFGSALYFTTLSTLRQFAANTTSQASFPGGVAMSSSSIAKSSSVLPKLSSSVNLITGATARVVAGLALMPVTVIKVRYESDLYAYRSLWSAGSHIYKSEGVRGFFSGFGATAIRDAPYAGLYVVFYEASKNHLSGLVSYTSDGLVASGTSSAAVNALSGVVAAAIATAVTNPFDAVKTRLQLMPAKYTNMLSAARLMLSQEGPKSFFNGLGLRMGRKALSSALAWTVYEELVSRAERKFTIASATESSAIA